jgi:hypothetical protein
VLVSTEATPPDELVGAWTAPDLLWAEMKGSVS